jgi:dTDP-4-dehydrorhamnose reductase
VSDQILVTGGRGLLGRALSAMGATHVHAVGRREVDITNLDEIEQRLLLGRPAAVINTAALSGIEASEADPNAARAINADAPARLAEFCARRMRASLWPSPRIRSGHRHPSFQLHVGCSI